MSDKPDSPPALERPYADPTHKGNRVRPRVRCVGCRAMGCVTAWGPWCFKCNVARMDRIGGVLAPVEAMLRQRQETTDGPSRAEPEVT